MPESTSQTRQLVNQMLAKLNARDRDGTAEDMRRLLEIDGSVGPAWGHVVKIAEAIGETTLMIEAARRVYKDQPGDVKRACDFAAVLARLGRHEEATDVLMKFRPKDRNGSVLIQHLLGTIASEQGDFERARTHLRNAIALAPGSGPTWLTLAHVEKIEDGSLDHRALEELGSKPAGGDDGAAMLFFALGKARDDIGDSDKAFDAYLKGSGIVRNLRPYDPRSDEAAAEILINSYSKEFFDGLGESDSEAAPIFIVGNPRSGTTLLAQMLGLHSELTSIGESNLMQKVFASIGRFRAEDVKAFDEKKGPEGWKRVGDAFLAVSADRSGNTLRPIDKTLITSRFVGMIAQAMPKARFINLTRDPADTAASCFRNYFATGLTWTFSLTDIATHLRAEEKLCQHWAETFPEQFMVLPYEEFVADPETHLKKIATFCDFQFEETMLHPEQATDAVNTASVQQVRQPVSKTAVGAWKRYEGRFDPFFKAYG